LLDSLGFNLTQADVIKGVITALVLLIAVVGHEIMHGLSAYKYGDSTAKNAGRLSINPIKHIDPVGTVVVPLMLLIAGSPFLIGWAKPVPVDIRHIIVSNRSYNGAIVVSLAGVAYNFAFAIVASLLIGFFIGGGSMMNEIIAYFLLQAVIINVVLGVFNLLPIPPLDGSQALSYIGAKFGVSSIGEFFDKIGNYGMIIIIVILVTPLKVVLFAPVTFLINILL
jgi:Zn-dependent protease